MLWLITKPGILPQFDQQIKSLAVGEGLEPPRGG
jgi:hypothetical protein